MIESVKIIHKLNKSDLFSRIMSRKKIIIIDEQSIFRTGLIVLLKTPLPEAHVLEASTLDEALRNYQSADLVIYDISNQSLNRLTFIPEIKIAWPDAKVIVLTSTHQGDAYDKSIAAGADCFLSKSLLSCQIVSAIVAILAETRGFSAYVPKLTNRQLEVLDFMGRGMSNKMIAKECGISENTVRWHVQLILIELQASTRLEAIFNARNLGLISSMGR